MSTIHDNKDDNMNATTVDLSNIKISIDESFFASTQHDSTNVSTITFTGTNYNNGQYQVYDSNGWLDDAFIFNTEQKEFIDVMPPMDIIKEMCDLYPGFKKVFENFKNFYDLVKDDFNTRKNSDE